MTLIDRLADQHVMACQLYKYAKENSAHELAQALLEFCEQMDNRIRAMAGVDPLMKLMLHPVKGKRKNHERVR